VTTHVLNVRLEHRTWQVCTTGVPRAFRSPLSTPPLRAALTIHSRCTVRLLHKSDLHVLAHGDALAVFELRPFVPIVLRSSGKLGAFSRPDLQRACCAALMLTAVAAAGAGLDLEAAAASSRGLLRSPSRLGGRQGCWDGLRAEGVASARIRAAMTAPCGRVSNRALRAVRDGTASRCVWRRGGEGRRRGGQASGARMRGGRASSLGWRAGAPSHARGARVPARSVPGRCAIGANRIARVWCLYAPCGPQQTRSRPGRSSLCTHSALAKPQPRVERPRWCNRNLSYLFWPASCGQSRRFSRAPLTAKACGNRSSAPTTQTRVRGDAMV
jgi:hypothetical protein